MKLWLFTFTQSDRPFCSARVAAPERADACRVMSLLLQRPLIAQENEHPEPGTILTVLGKDENEVRPRLISVMDNDGVVQVPK